MFCLIVLFSIYKCSIIRFYYIVLLFGLAINLQTEGRKKLLLNVKKVTEQKLELGGKNRFLITNDKVGKTVVLYNHINNYFCKAWSIDDYFIVYHLGQAIDYDKN